MRTARRFAPAVAQTPRPVGASCQGVRCPPGTPVAGLRLYPPPANWAAWEPPPPLGRRARPFAVFRAPVAFLRAFGRSCLAANRRWAAPVRYKGACRVWPRQGVFPLPGVRFGIEVLCGPLWIFVDMRGR